jgi:hypothetical protein
LKPVLSVAVDVGAIERVACDAAVVSLFEGDRPLRGEAGRVDWRLCGALSRLLGRGILTGAVGEAALLPSQGRLRAARVLVLGLGDATGFGTVDAKVFARDAVLRLARLGTASVALGLPGHWLGLAPEGPCAGAILRGAVSALEESGLSLRLRLVVPESAAARALGGIEAALRSLGESAVSVQLTGREPVSMHSARGPAVPRRSADPG